MPAITPQNGRVAFLALQSPHTYWELNATNLGTNFGDDATANDNNTNVAAGDISTSGSYQGMNSQNDPPQNGWFDIYTVTDAAALIYIPAGLSVGTSYGLFHNGGGTNAQTGFLRNDGTDVEICISHNTGGTNQDNMVGKIPNGDLPGWFCVGWQFSSEGGAQGDMGLWINGTKVADGTRAFQLAYGSGNPDFGSSAGDAPLTAGAIAPYGVSTNWPNDVNINGTGILIANFCCDNPNQTNNSPPGNGDQFHIDYYNTHVVPAAADNDSDLGLETVPVDPRNPGATYTGNRWVDKDTSGLPIVPRIENFTFTEGKFSFSPVTGLPITPRIGGATYTGNRWVDGAVSPLDIAARIGSTTFTGNRWADAPNRTIVVDPRSGTFTATGNRWVDAQLESFGLISQAPTWTATTEIEDDDQTNIPSVDVNVIPGPVSVDDGGPTQGTGGGLCLLSIATDGFMGSGLNSLAAASRGFLCSLVTGETSLLVSTNLELSTQTPITVVPYQVLLNEINLGIFPQNSETVVPYEIRLNGQVLELTSQQIETINLEFKFSGIPTTPLDLITRQVELILGEISNLDEVTIEIEPLVPLALLTNEALVPPETIDLTARLPEGLLGEMSLLAVPNLEIDSESVIAYTLPTGQEVWSEKVRYTLYLTKRRHFNIKR